MSQREGQLHAAILAGLLEYLCENEDPANDVHLINMALWRVLDSAFAEDVTMTMVVNARVHHHNALINHRAEDMVRLYMATLIYLILLSGSYIASDAVVPVLMRDDQRVRILGNDWDATWRGMLIRMWPSQITCLWPPLWLFAPSFRGWKQHTHLAWQKTRCPIAFEIGPWDNDHSLRRQWVRGPGPLFCGQNELAQRWFFDIGPAVLVSPKTGSSAVGAILEALELVQGIDELLASGGYAINLDLMATVGANMTVERMREILNGIAADSGAYWSAQALSGCLWWWCALLFGLWPPPEGLIEWQASLDAIPLPSPVRTKSESKTCFFTDGSCLFPSVSDLRVAAAAVVTPSGPGTFSRVWSGLLPTSHQSIQRAELLAGSYATVSALHPVVISDSLYLLHSYGLSTARRLVTWLGSQVADRKHGSLGVLLALSFRLRQCRVRLDQGSSV